MPLAGSVPTLKGKADDNVVHTLQRVVDAVDRLEARVTQVERAAETSEIRALRDAIDRLERTVGILQRQVAALEAAP